MNWTYTVTNVGEDTPTDLMVIDDMGVIVMCPQADLAPTESMICAGTGRVGAEVEYINFGTATGIGVISGEEAESFDFGLAVTGGTGIGILGFGALGLMLVGLGVGLTLRQ